MAQAGNFGRFAFGKKQVNQSNLGLDLIKKKADQVYGQASDMLKLKEYITQILKIHSKNEINKTISSLKFDIEECVDYSKLVHYIGFVNVVQDKLQEDIEKITKKYILQSVNYAGLTLCALFVDTKKKNKVQELLEKYDFSAIDNPVLKENYDLESKSGVKFVKLGYEAEKLQKE